MSIKASSPLFLSELKRSHPHSFVCSSFLVVNFKALKSLSSESIPPSSAPRNSSQGHPTLHHTKPHTMSYLTPILLALASLSAASPVPRGNMNAGQLTFFHPGLGACGQNHHDGSLITAILAPLFDSRRPQYCGNHYASRAPWAMSWLGSSTAARVATIGILTFRLQLSNKPLVVSVWAGPKLNGNGYRLGTYNQSAESQFPDMLRLHSRCIAHRDSGAHVVVLIHAVVPYRLLRFDNASPFLKWFGSSTMQAILAPVCPS
ncbi:uncharacterized protein F5Z01DRAFT_479737 [Emericellopsis atlantica]|uniref:Uncharacterized protein n=1 Tax=Emericellopsis atlantica TaxID=2614577 RepID=A0A9P7ZS18_9HYPO|nr:uncharacterized protein F5Z01DRAFT_479737 [Emericellopsis atlantica]KAG9256608.1 hypothetical protein F5Z01DRAFT_479737 [Emericellopsis atlantica]